MRRPRFALIATTAIASAALLAGCASTTTEEPEVTAAVGGDIPDLRAEAPVPAPEQTTAPTPEPQPMPEGYGYAFDDGGVLSVVLPQDWAVDGRPFTTSDGREWASITAAPDLANYATDWNVAGLEFGGTPMGQQLGDDVTTAFLNDLAAPLAASCQVAKQAEPYNDGLYAGFFSTFGNCNGGDTFGIVVVAQDPEFSHFVYLRGKFVSEQDKGDTFNLIFTTFQSTQGLEQASDDEDRAFVPGR
ncbi:MAG: hypothetical protein KF727_04525 [Microbacteriaceae bacterium]|nr:hypothetical protein [Microbacteriaceae bacterium]